MKRKFLFLGCLVLLIVLLIYGIGRRYWQIAPVERQSYGLHTRLGMKVWGVDQQVLSQAFDLIAKYEGILDPETGELGRVNVGAYDHGVVVSDTLWELLQRSVEASVKTSFAFNPALGPVIRLWDINGSHPHVPSMEQIDRARKLSQLDDCLFNHQVHAVRFQKKGMGLYLGAVAKGFVADRVKEFLINNGAYAGILDFGGNILTFGNKPDGQSWTVGLRAPFKSVADLAAVVTLPNGGSVVTSGPYEQYFEQDGKRYHHIFDPQSGCPSDQPLEAVTVIAEKSEIADLLSTALFVLGPDKGKTIVETFEGVTAVFYHDHHLQVVGPLANQIQPRNGWTK